MNPTTQPAEKAVTPDQILQLGFGFWASKTLLSAIDMGVFTELGGDSLTLETLAHRLKLHPRSSHDFLDALVALGMLNRHLDEYSNTPATGKFLDKKSPFYLGGILEMCEKRLYPFWGNLTEGLRTGLPQNEVKSGVDPFVELYKTPERVKVFLEGMTGISLGAAHAIAGKFNWADYKSFVDIGCAQGALPVTVATAHPHLKGFGADLPVVKSIFEEFVSEHNLSNRLSFAPLDFFRAPLPSADVIVMGHILHDWDLPTKKMLVKKAYDALPTGGAFVVYEALIDDERRQNAFGLLMSLNMLIETPGGFDYTGADATAWMTEAGFKNIRVEHLLGPDSMVIGVK